LHLGYRRLSPLPGAAWAEPLSAHEFHYASLIQTGPGVTSLFHAWDSMGNDLGDIGVRKGNVMGSFAHVIARR
ncbi:MAG: cobyrinic acid a,c-diamide synthase, partial [Rhodospirillales bacterium]|nr:cobyrinic acid a,c-diamide synthase [Rhodospirillales bacterium]